MAGVASAAPFGQFGASPAKGDEIFVEELHGSVGATTSERHGSPI
ncbi:MAG: hypothetical protein OXI01_22020 [Albidovulum sp.]|nr:hypothetical protein [Albidovulum sp.]